jgi:hypothetical protein
VRRKSQGFGATINWPLIKADQIGSGKTKFTGMNRINRMKAKPGSLWFKPKGNPAVYPVYPAYPC